MYRLSMQMPLIHTYFMALPSTTDLSMPQWRIVRLQKGAHEHLHLPIAHHPNCPLALRDWNRRD